MKKFEYREPEFKVVMTAKEDIITASTSNTLNTVSSAWDPSQSGEGTGRIGFGL